MDILLNLSNVNRLYEDGINNGNLRLVHQLEHPDLDYDTFISTRCNSTTDTIRYLISNSIQWESVSIPTQEVYQVAFILECDDDGDDPVHSMIVHGDYVYQSFCGLYSLRKTYIPNLKDLLSNPSENWFQLTGDLDPLKLPVQVQYSQTHQLDLSLIESKYKKLTVGG